MSELSGQIRDVLAVVALAAVLEMLLPRTGVRRMGQLVMGLLVVLALTKPLLGVLGLPATGPDDQLGAARDAEGELRLRAPPAWLASTEAITRRYLRESLEAMVATALGASPGDVSVEVEMGPATGWSLPLKAVRVRVAALSERTIAGWVASLAGADPTAAAASPPQAAPGSTEVGAEDRRAAALATAAAALAAEIAAVYRMDPGAVRVTMPR